MRPTLAVVIPCRDEEALLPAMLASLAAQDVAGWVETVVVDDGSRDRTVAVAHEHGDHLPGFRVVRTPPSNRPAAINAGWTATSAEAVVFVDGDDEVAPGYLAALQAALARHPFVAARLDHEAVNPRWMWGIRPYEQASTLPHEPQRPWPVAAGGTLAVRRELLEAVGGFDEAVIEVQDADLVWRIAMAGVFVELVPDAALRYRYRPTARATFAQASRYGRGGVVLAHRFGPGIPRWQIVRRLAKLVLLARRLPFLVRRRDRFATAFEAGSLAGWLHGALRPGQFPPDALLPQTDPLARRGVRPPVPEPPVAADGATP